MAKHIDDDDYSLAMGAGIPAMKKESVRQTLETLSYAAMNVQGEITPDGNVSKTNDVLRDSHEGAPYL